MMFLFRVCFLLAPWSMLLENWKILRWLKMIPDDCICDFCDFLIKWSTSILDLTIILKWWVGRWVVHVGCIRHMHHWDWHSHWLQRSRGGLVVSTWHPRKEAWREIHVLQSIDIWCLGNCFWDEKMYPFSFNFPKLCVFFKPRFVILLLNQY